MTCLVECPFDRVRELIFHVLSEIASGPQKGVAP